MKVENYATQDVATVAPGDSIDRAIELMESEGFHHVVVVDQDRVVGMLSDREILISTGWMRSEERTIHESHGQTAVIAGPTLVEEIMTRPAVWLVTDNSCRFAAMVMLRTKASALPVIDGGERLVGLITETDLLRWLDILSSYDAAANRTLSGLVRHKMQTDVAHVGADAPLDDVVELFRARRIRHVPVVTNGVVKGIISDRDVRRALGWAFVRDEQAEAGGYLMEPEPQRAAEVMQTPVLTIGSSAALRQALRFMVDREIHCLPVVENTRLVGIITQTDLIGAIARERLL